MALKKIQTDIAARTAAGVTIDDAASYPQVIEYLTAEAYPDGSKRVTSTLVIVCDGAAWRVGLSDKDNARIMWKQGSTLVGALESVELALMDDDPSHWRKAYDGPKGKPKRS